MKSRVNIQYSIDMEELDAEVLRLVQKVFNVLNTHLTLQVDEDAVLSFATAEKLDELRQQMAKADYMLQDIVSLINGYLTHKAGQLEEEEEETAPSADIADPTEDSVEDIIKKFKEKVGIEIEENEISD